MPAGGAAMMSAVLIHVQVSSVHVFHATLEDFVISNVGKWSAVIRFLLARRQRRHYMYVERKPPPSRQTAASVAQCTLTLSTQCSVDIQEVHCHLPVHNLVYDKPKNNFQNIILFGVAYSMPLWRWLYVHMFSVSTYVCVFLYSVSTVDIDPCVCACVCVCSRPEWQWSRNVSPCSLRWNSVTNIVMSSTLWQTTSNRSTSSRPRRPVCHSTLQHT